jgi:hypothetical protein
MVEGIVDMAQGQERPAAAARAQQRAAAGYGQEVVTKPDQAAQHHKRVKCMLGVSRMNGLMRTGVAEPWRGCNTR